MDFTPKRVGETEVFTVDYTDMLPAGVTIQSAAWSIATVHGTDKTSEMIVGFVSISGPRVSQLIAGGVRGVSYYPTCTATCSDGQIIILPEPGEGLLRVV